MLQKFKNTVRGLLKPALHKAEIKRDFSVLGSAYGGWPLLDDTPRSALVYSFGIGEDISFDLAAIAKFNCRVIGFDPTPKSLKWIERQTLPASFSFYPLGIADFDGAATFYPPDDEAYTSYSLQRAKSSNNKPAVSADVLRLRTVVEKLGTPTPDVLKMDIEGFEYGVIRDILRGPIRPRQMLIEFHHRMYGIDTQQTMEAVTALRIAGYALFYVSPTGHEYGFVAQ